MRPHSMCLIFLGHRTRADLPLVLAANRDEFVARPAAAAEFWPDSPRTLGGRDLKQGGAWLAVDRSGRWAAVTNYRDPADVRPEARSRGDLVREFVQGDASPAEFLRRASADRREYNGYNLLLSDGVDAYYYSNVSDAVRRLEPGVYGLSNHLLDTPWPKVASGKAEFAAALAGAAPAPEDFFRVLANDRRAPDAQLPATGVPLEIERALSARFITLPGYGTRCSTVVLRDGGGALQFIEKSYDESGAPSAERKFQLQLEASDGASVTPVKEARA